MGSVGLIVSKNIKKVLSNSRKMSERKAVIKNADMAEDMQQDAIECATQAMEKFNPTWHAIVGRNFGSYVTHETKHFIYFYLGQVAILVIGQTRKILAKCNQIYQTLLRLIMT